MAQRSVIWLAGLLAMALGACSGGSDEAATGPALETRDATAPRAAETTPGQFAFLRYSVDVDGDAPNLCLGFTHPLDPAVDYASYVSVTPARPIALDADGQTLCVGGLGFGDGQSLTLRAGLPAANGDGLLVDETVDVDFGDRPAYVGIAGDGVILPRLDADGLAIETVNVDSVAIVLRRINDRALAFRSITSGANVAAGDYYWSDQDEDPDAVGEIIWRGEMDTAGLLNTPVSTIFPIAEAIGTLSPGAYHISVVDAAEAEDDYRTPARATRWLVITDLALTAYRGAEGVDFMVRSLQTARPVADVRVELVARSNEVLASVTTDASGRARFDGPLTRGEGAMAPRLLTAYGPDNDFAVLDFQRNPVDLSGLDTSGRQRPEGADGFVYLDRGIYRPGEAVQVSALIRDAEARAISDRPVDLTVFGPNGIEAANVRFPAAADAGGVTWTWDIPRTAARGEWRIVAEMDGYGRVGQARFSVEDFVPQRVALTLDGDDETPIRAGETRDIEANVRFLYGAPGAGLVVEGRVRVEADPSPFSDYADFRFGRSDEPFREFTDDLPDTVADGAGQAVQTIALGAAGRDASQPLRLRAVISAIEPGGRPVADDVRIPYRPADLYLGLRPQFDGRAERNRETAIDVVALDPAGAAQAVPLDWQLVRIDWQYDWYRVDNGRWQWRRTREVIPIEQGVITTAAAGPASIDIRALDWGSYRLVVTDAASGQAASTDFWVGWGSTAQSGSEAPDRVALSTPDTATAVGDQVTLSLLPPYAGEAEIVIASDHVIETRSITIPQEGAELSFRVTEEWGAGAYAMVSLFTPRHPVDQPAPRRAVGIAYLPVDMGNRTFELALDVPDRIHPRQTLDLGITLDGPVREGAFVTVAAVDEGILALTRFASPDPVDWFFGQAALDVALYDDYGRLLDPNQGAAAAVRSGGDQIGGAGLTVVPTRTVALFSGPVLVGRNGRTTVSLDIPDFNGELRLMAVAWSTSAVGGLSQPVTVRDDVPAELILPRFLAPGDVSTATLTIDNVDGAAGDYQTTVSATGAVSASAGDRLSLQQGERADRRYPLTGADAGIGAVGLAVAGPDAFAVSRDYPIEVRSAWLPSSTVTRGRLLPGENWTLSAEALAAYLPGNSAVTLSFSPTPLDEAALLRSLSRYPYGCTEQITSRAMPLLLADPLAGAAGIGGVDGSRAIVQEAIATLLNRQANDGAIGLWRIGDRQSRPWIGAYAVDFLARAKAAGYTVPDAALDRAYAVLEHIAAQESWRASGYDTSIYSWRGQTDTAERLSDRSAAYALYVLARAGRVDRSRLRYMHDERLEQIDSPLARAQLGAALHLIGDRARSRSAFDAAEAALGYENRGDWYQSARRDLAGVVAYAAEAGDAERIARLAERVVAELPEPSRLSTQEKAFLLMAAQGLSGGADALSIDSELTAENPARPVYQLTPDMLDASLDFIAAGDGPVWVTQLAHGETREAPGEAAEGLSVQKRVLALDGSTVDLESLVQGDRLMIDITVSPHEQRLIPAILVDLLPPGFEIEAEITPSDAGARGPYRWLGEVFSPSMSEIRDDRYAAAMDLTHRRPRRLAYIVRAVTPGEYTLPGAVVEDMYRSDVFARSETRRIVIAPRD
ncbi:alpha-2-macroglobulin [Maricaulis sp. W15]|uniref:alpha-2-macroglobulin family protein n=1 Tax=Maricaulis sp. W15 TaxID=1772333 RepID=UPI000948C1D6|nr:alpha-2-macroglobulin [Maricaulis sp. W15]OLF77734.1 alpha-2-macroglobulin [Maricaulis sp. W15]